MCYCYHLTKVLHYQDQWHLNAAKFKVIGDFKWKKWEKGKNLMLQRMQPLLLNCIWFSTHAHVHKWQKQINNRFSPCLNIFSCQHVLKINQKDAFTLEFNSSVLHFCNATEKTSNWFPSIFVVTVRGAHRSKKAYGIMMTQALLPAAFFNPANFPTVRKPPETWWRMQPVVLIWLMAHCHSVWDRACCASPDSC